MQELNCSGLVFGLDLETNAADEVRYLPIQPAQVFVPKKYVNSRALKHSPNDNSLREIAISGYRYEITQFRLTIHFFEDGWLQAPACKLGSQRGLCRIGKLIVRLCQLQ